MRQFLQQTLQVMRQNTFHTMVCMTGTAVTIALVMVVVMVYDFRTADIAPESDRTQMMYSDLGHTRRTDGTNASWGMGPVAYEALFTDLPGVEKHTYYGGFSKALFSLPGASDRFPYMVRYVAANWFSFFSYDFLAGRAFTQAEYDLGRQAFEAADDDFRNMKAVNAPGRRQVVVTERVARTLFGSVQAAVGQVFWLDFHPSTVVGVVRNVSSMFQTAYADAFVPFTLLNEPSQWRVKETAGLGGQRRAVLKLLPEGKPSVIKEEVERREMQLNNRGMEYVFIMQRMYTHREYAFFRDSSVDARWVYALLIIVLLCVPAISISGLVHAQVQSRLSEMAIRKAYGASNLSLLARFFGEGLVSVLIGGVVGYALSSLLVWMGRMWLLGVGGVELSGISLGGGLLFRPSLFVAVLAVCLVFNLLSVLLPVTLALHRPIVQTLKGE